MEKTADGLPVLVFDESSVPSEHQFEVFHETTAPIFDTHPLSAPDSFRASATDYLVDDLVISRLSYDAQVMRRTALNIRNGLSDSVAILLHHRGGLHGAVGADETLELNADQVGFLDLREPFAAWGDATPVTWLVIPRDRLLGSHPSSHSIPFRAWRRGSPRGTVVSAAVNDAWNMLGTATAHDAPRLAEEIVENVASALSPDDFLPSDAALLSAMKQHITVNLDDLSLDADALQTAFHWSRSSVYRLFEAEGGVGAYIRNLRLLRCFEDLTRPSKLPRRVSHVASRWGFDNPSHFNRLFRAKFGVPPSAVNVGRAQASPTWSAPETRRMIHQFHTWATSV